jgi:Uncharacterized conserved protein
LDKIILYNPAISTLNIGDYIIAESCKRELEEIFQDAFYIDVSTHMPISRRHFGIIGEVFQKIVLGSNLLSFKIKEGKHIQWDIGIEDADIVGPAILMGVGSRNYIEQIDDNVKEFYNKVLNKNYMHSVRESYTLEKLKSIGINNVINTGCPTTWKLTKEHCKSIPIEKAKNVVCTLTDYDRDEMRDVEILKTLEKNYNTIYYWIQGSKDYKYIQHLGYDKKVKIIEPSLDKYNEFLKNNKDIDFVGTRLHGGIKALQNKIRTIIIAIDNRAIEMKRDINLPVIERKEIYKLQDYINSKFATDICINIEGINLWKNQFKI